MELTNMTLNFDRGNASFTDEQNSLEDGSFANSSHHQSWFEIMEEENEENRRLSEYFKNDIKGGSTIKPDPDDIDNQLFDEIYSMKKVNETCVKSDIGEKHVTEVKTIVNVKLKPEKEEGKLLLSDTQKTQLQVDTKNSLIKSPLTLEENISDSQGFISDLLSNGLYMVTPIKQDQKTETTLPEPVKLKGLDIEDEEDVLEVTLNKEEEEGLNHEEEENTKQNVMSTLKREKQHLLGKRVRAASSSSSSSNSRTDPNKLLDYADSSPSRKKRNYERETDPVVLARRQKQIDYGKNTVGYDVYSRVVPKNSREKHHPKTPLKHLKYSRRAWDGLIKVWRLELACFDPNPQTNDSGRESCSDLSSTTTSNESGRKGRKLSDSDRSQNDSGMS